MQNGCHAWVPASLIPHFPPRQRSLLQAFPRLQAASPGEGPGWRRDHHEAADDHRPGPPLPGPLPPHRPGGDAAAQLPDPRHARPPPGAHRPAAGAHRGAQGQRQPQVLAGVRGMCRTGLYSPVVSHELIQCICTDQWATGAVDVDTLKKTTTN